MGDNDAMSKAIELEMNEQVLCLGTYGNNGCGWSGKRRELTAVACCPCCGGGHIKRSYDGMNVDMRAHPQIREQVRAGLGALLVQGRQIWGETRHTLPQIMTRLTVGVGDLARLARDGGYGIGAGQYEEARRELKKELGNVVFSTVRWIDDLGLDVLECLDLAIDAQEKFAQSGRPR